VNIVDKNQLETLTWEGQNFPVSCIL